MGEGLETMVETPSASAVRRRLRDPLVLQAIAPERDHLSGVGVILSTRFPEKAGEILLRFYAMESIDPPRNPLDLAPPGFRLLAEKRVSASILYEDEQFDLYFPPIPDSSGRSFLLSLSPIGADPAAGVAPWLCEDETHPPEFLWSWHRGHLASKAHLELALHYSPPEAGAVPGSLLLSPVTQCNLNCVHCISRDTRKSLSFLPEEEKEEIARLARSGQIRSVSADYSGDLFFVDQKYGGILDYFLGLGIDLYFDTHGNHMSEALAERLLRSRMRRINFSIDAGTAATHASIRRGSRPFHEVIANIRLFCRTRREMGREDVGVTLSVTLMRRNLDELPLCVDLAAECGVDEVCTRHLEVYTDDMEKESLYAHQEEYDRKRPVFLEYAKSKGVKMSMPRPFGRVAERGGHRHCPVAWESATVLGNGDVMACCIPTTKMGNLREQSLEAIWNGPAYREFRRRLNSDDPPEACRHCPIFRFEKNPTSYFFNRVRKNLRTLGESLLPPPSV